MQVKSIDVNAIHERLRKDKTKEGKEVWNYVKKLLESLEMQKKLNGHAIEVIKRISNQSKP